MFDGIACAVKGFFGRRWDRAMTSGPRPADQTCMTCAAFEYCDPEDIDGCDGYCGHGDHSDPAKSPHYEYGGHWTSHGSWCRLWIPADAAQLAERVTEREEALRRSQPAVGA